MKIRMMLVLLMALVVCSSCSEKKENRAASAVKVKTMTVQPQTLSGEFHYSGTIEEISGTTLSFVGIGTVKSIHVSEGQFISKGQLVGVLSDRTFTGRITEKGVTADPVSRTYEVKAEIENSRHELLPGTTAALMPTPTCRINS